MQSARLAQSWTTQSLRTVSSVSVPFDGCVLEDTHLVGGRWFLVCQEDRRFVLYDTNPDAKTRAPQVLWEQGENIIAWDNCLATSEEGQCVVYVLFIAEDSPQWYVCVMSIRGALFIPNNPCRTLLEFRLDAESGALCDTVILDVPVLRAGVDRRLGDYDGREPLVRPPFLTMQSQSLVFDIRTRVFYKFPAPSIALVCLKGCVACAMAH